MTYPEHEHRHALDRIMREAGLPIGIPVGKTCPECGEWAEWEAYQSAEDGMCRHATPAGYYCGCGWRELTAADEPDDDDREDQEPFDEFTSGWGPMRRGDA